MTSTLSEKLAPLVMVVNDELTQLGVLSVLLQKEGLEVMAFPSAETALAAIDPRRLPDLIITDLYMPVIDGWRFCRLLRSAEYRFCNDIPILVISAIFSGEEASRITRELGATAFLPAPVHPRKFINHVRSALAGRSPCHTLRVLIVENDRNLASILKNAFAKHGYEADVALTFQTAAETFAEVPYDIAVLDYHLPDGTGDLLLKDLLTNCPDCVCLMMTTDPSQELALAWMRQGAAAYLRKPFEAEYLIEVVSRACRERTLLRVEDLLAKRSCELREAEQRYHTLFSQNSDGMLILDPVTTRPLEFNEQASRQLGYSREEFAGLRLADIEAQETPEESRVHIQKIMDEGSDDFETLQRTKQGEIRHVHVTARLIDVAGRPVYYCIWRDITERKLAAEKLRASEGKLIESNQLMAGILEHTHMLVGYLDVRFKYKLVNRAFAEACRHDPGFFPGKSHFALFPNETQEKIFHHVVDTGKPFYAYAKPFAFADQPESGAAWWDWSLIPTRDAADSIAGLVFTLTEVTDRIRAEEALQQNARELQWLLKSMINPFALFESIFDENENFISYRFVYVNDAYERSTGVKNEEARGRTVQEVWPGTRPKWIKRYGAVAVSGVSQNFDMYHDPTGKYFHCNVYRPWDTKDRFCVIFEDVTARVRMEEALRRREELLNTTQRLTKVGGWEWDVDNQTMFWTEEVFRIHGLPPEPVTPGQAELAARSLKCYDIEDRPAILSAFRRCANTGESYDLELPFTTFDGRRIWIRTGAKAVSESGKIVRLIGSISDITERKKAETALRDSEERYRLLFASMDSALALYEIIRNEQGAPCNYRFLEINPAFEKMTGLRAADLIGNMMLAVLPNTEPCWLKRYGRVVDSGETAHFEYYCRDLKRYYAVTAYRIRLEQFAVIYMDISDRKRSEMERERLLSAIEQSGETIVITDAVGIIQYVNPAFERITGYSREEAIGQNPRILKSGKHDTAFYKEMWRLITDGGNWQGRFINQRKDGALYTEQATISPVRDANDRIVNYVAVKRDITDQLRFQEENARLEVKFHQTQKLESVGRLAGGIAHDLNNLLTPILGYGEMLRDTFSKGDSRKAELHEIVKAGKRARDLVRQLLAFSRKQVMEFKPIDLNSVLSQFERLLRRTIREDVAVDVILARSLPLINGDIGQLEQVIMNLAVNAQDAMPNGGRLFIETGTVDVDEIYATGKPGMRAGPYVRLLVSDTGGGMDEKTLAQIFEPFFTTKEKDRGTGLGLATVYGIVKQHGGSIGVYSEPGKGSTFKLYFPLSAALPPVEEIPEAKTTDKGGSETILLVEDNEQVRYLARKILERWGYSLIIAHDGIDALRILAQCHAPPHLLLTDVVMPGMSGRELFDQIKAQYPDIKVLYMSGYTDNVIVHHGVLDAGIHFIQKPFAVKGLLDKIRQVLDPVAGR